LRAWPVWRLALILYAISLPALGVAIAFRKSDLPALVWLVYAAAGVFVAAALVTLFGISLIGDRPKR
jgi:presenilin-like A22 family membrane protease